MASGAADSPVLPRWLMTAWIIGATSSVIMLAGGIAALAAVPPRWTFGAAATGLYLAYAAQSWWMFRRIGSFGLPAALAFPLPLSFFLVVFARSFWLTRRGNVTWRGRAVAVRPKGRRAVRPRRPERHVSRASPSVEESPRRGTGTGSSAR